MIFGVDEAGRGCVIGPMVIALASIDPMDEHELLKLGVKDSKKLSPRQRDSLIGPIRELCGVKSAHISAEEITKLMDTHNLNDIEAMHVAGLMKDIPLAARGYIDSPDNVPMNFAKRIKRFMPQPPKLVCENKADDHYPIVAAASIVAKVERDAEIEKIKRIVGVDFNSGYTSDPMTMAFLTRHMDDRNIQKYIRHKWATLENLKQRKMTDFD